MKLHRLESATHVWGITPEAVFILLADTEIGTNNLGNFTKLESIVRNHHVQEDEYKDAIKGFANYLGLLKDDNVSLLGKIALLNEEPLLLIQTCLMVKDHQLRNFLVDIARNHIDRMHTSEVETYFPGDSEFICKLLKSFHILEIEGGRVYFDTSLVKQIGEVKSFPRKTENWLVGKSFSVTLVGNRDPELVSSLTSRLLTSVNIPFEETDKNLSIIDAIKHVGNEVQSIIRTLTSQTDHVTNALMETETEYSNRNNEILSHLTSLKIDESGNVSIDRRRLVATSRRYHIKLSKLREMINQILFLQKHFPQIHFQYLINIYEIHKIKLTEILAEVFGEKIRVTSHFIHFLRKFKAETAYRGELKDYLTFLFQEYARNSGRIKSIETARKLLEISRDSPKEIFESKVEHTLYTLLNMANSKQFSPFYFVYTLPLPANLGKETVGKFKGKSVELEREVYKLQAVWPQKRTDTSFTYSDMADRLLSKGLERELQTKEIRIMTPYTDYELEKYVSMLRSLITKGYTIHIICRLHADKRRWKRFNDGLLKGLGIKSKAVKVRTYTRFKEFRSKIELEKLKGGQRMEFGVHAKLFIIGDPANGALLMGSANLLDNSYHWNPETGIYTENPNFIESATAFFDFVWNLSINDELDFSKLDRIPKGPFFPSAYT